MALAGFYPVSTIVPSKAVLMPLRNAFQINDQNLYLAGAARTIVQNNPLLKQLYETPSIALTVIQNNRYFTSTMSLWDSTQQLEVRFLSVPSFGESFCLHFL